MVYFTDFFGIDEKVLEDYGAFNISLINDLPLFIDPFLLYGSQDERYKQLHRQIIEYLTFLKKKSEKGQITVAQRKSWFKFSEVKQNWLGFSVSGNGGSGLGEKFAKAMSLNMGEVYQDLNNEQVTSSSHIEKICLFELGVGKDNISDFTCNLIKSFLCEYTENFSIQNIDADLLRKVNVEKAYFDYRSERWMPKEYTLPFHNGDFILLTPRKILTKDENWINGNDLRGNFLGICATIPNDQLRSEINTFYLKELPAPKLVGKGKNQRKKGPSKKEIAEAVNQTIKSFPEIASYYIKLKEENKGKAKSVANSRIIEAIEVFKENVTALISQLTEETDFYKINPDSSFKESMKRVLFMKDVIENKDGYKLFYHKGQPLKREADVQVIYRLTWFSTPYDVNREVNNGRGPVDYSISKGSADKTLIEFKLASNRKLKMNLQNQVEVYKKASNTANAIKVILYFDTVELQRVNNILNDLGLQNDPSIVLIDAGNNKPSASNVR
ncbi:MAG: hypothetical protein AB3N18_03010 [Allomuricauda sp.]